MSACQAEAALADALAQAHEHRAAAGAQLAQAQRKAAAALAAAAEANARAGRPKAENAALADLVAAPCPKPSLNPITLDPNLTASAQPPAAPAESSAQAARISLAAWSTPSGTAGAPPGNTGEHGAAAAPPDINSLKQQQPSERLCARTAAPNYSADPSNVQAGAAPLAFLPSLKQQQPSEQLRARQAAAAAAAAAASDTTVSDACPRAPPSSPHASPARQRPPRLAGGSAQQAEIPIPDLVRNLKPVHAPPQHGAGAGELAPATPVRQKMAKAPGGVLYIGPEGYCPTVEGPSAVQAGKAPSKTSGAPARAAVRCEAEALLERLQARA